MTQHALHPIQQQAGARFMPYGPAEHGVEVVESFGHYQAEYAAIRKGVGLMHLPHRGVLRLTGGDRRDFLNRMLTQDIAAMVGGDSRRAFLLNEKGRIVTDMIVHHGDVDTWLEMDRFDLDATAAALDRRLFTEDVKIENRQAMYEILALLGPACGRLLAAASGASEDDLLRPGIHQVIHAHGAAVSVTRRDLTGSPGLIAFVPVEQAADIYRHLAAIGGGLIPDVDQSHPDAGAGPKRPIVGRGIGWLAFNTARIEAATPLFHIDYGTDCLPHETGLLDDAVSFKKGCYLGQEIVARMQNLGHPRRMLAGLHLDDDHLPIAGSQVFDAEQSGSVIGAVTSSTLAPMRGNIAIAIAMLKWGNHQPGTRVLVPAEGRMVPAAVRALSSLT